jgi:glyoxylase I family protein
MIQSAAPVPIDGIHHFAYKARDAEETRHFYEDILGLPLVMVLEVDNVTVTTGETLSFIHFFFQMNDGNYVAFFDFGDGKAPVLDPSMPKMAQHLAFRVKDDADIAAAMALLDAHGIPYQGPMDHDFVRSIYFWDPNGVRLEYAFTFADESVLSGFKTDATAALERWTSKVREKAAALTPVTA